MARFNFALESVLKARRNAEHERQRAVAELEQERRGLEERLRRAQEAISRGRQELRGDLVGSIDIAGLRMTAASAMQLSRDAQRLALQLAGVHRQLDMARHALVEASRQRRAVELLKERRFARFKAMLDKAETAALDELAVTAAARTAELQRKEPAT